MRKAIIVIACIFMLLILLQFPAYSEEKEKTSIDYQMEIVRLKLDKLKVEMQLKDTQFKLLDQVIVNARKAELGKQYRALVDSEAKLIAQLKDLQAQKKKQEAVKDEEERE